MAQIDAVPQAREPRLNHISFGLVCSHRRPGARGCD